VTNASTFLFFFTPCVFPQSTHQPTNALNKMNLWQVLISYVTAPGFHSQSFFPIKGTQPRND